MFTRERVPMVYTRAENLSDAAVHVLGVVAALIAVPVLVTLAVVWSTDTSTVVASVVYGLSLLAMLSCSAIYNMTPLPAWKDFLRRADQSAIYLKIAGGYTPFAVLAGSHAGLLLTGIWSAALAGASLTIFSPTRMRWASVVLYLCLGWAGAVLGGPIVEAMTPTGFLLLIVAGSIYSAGVIFFLWERLPFHYTIWHVFVLAASFVLYAAVLIELWERAST